MSKIISATEKEDHLILTFSTWENYRYHYVWLRHACECINTEKISKGCKHPKTKEKILNCATIPMDIKPESVKINETKLEIVWNGQEKHISIYDASFLEKFHYSKFYAPPKLSDIQLDQKEMTNQKVFEILSAYRMLVIRNGPKEIEDTEKIVEVQFGSPIIETHFGKIEDLMPNNKTNKNNDQLGYTFEGVDLHTDQPFIQNPPNAQLLHCIVKAQKGGANTLCDARLATQELKRRNFKHFEVLSTFPVIFHRKQQEFESIVRSPILQVDSKGVHLDTF
jgi:hypothetical protein